RPRARRELRQVEPRAGYRRPVRAERPGGGARGGGQPGGALRRGVGAPGSRRPARPLRDLAAAGGGGGAARRRAHPPALALRSARLPGLLTMRLVIGLGIATIAAAILFLGFPGIDLAASRAA